jgi:hypothetical protein
MTTWDEASRCPRDGQYTGKVVSRKPMGLAGQLVTLECPEDNCPYHDIGWTVQVRRDGTIPEPTMDRPKEFVTGNTSEAT